VRCATRDEAASRQDEMDKTDKMDKRNKEIKAHLSFLSREAHFIVRSTFILPRSGFINL
jgi:hypothetical protein